MRQKGFNLIELMVVLAIIGILAGIAVPSYQRYIQKAKFSQIIALTEPYKLAFEVALATGEVTSAKEMARGKFVVPDDLEVKKEYYLKSLKIVDGKIVATGDESVSDATYILTPIDPTDKNNLLSVVTWKVEGSCVSKGFCKGEQVSVSPP